MLGLPVLSKWAIKLKILVEVEYSWKPQRNSCLNLDLTQRKPEAAG